MTPSIRLRAEKKLDKLFPFYWMNKLSKQEEKELIAFIKDWLKIHGYTQKDLADELKIKSSRTTEILVKLKDLYKKGGIINIAKNLIKIEQNWLKNITTNFQESENIESYDQLNINPELSDNQSYNQLDIDSVVKQIDKDTCQ